MDSRAASRQTRAGRRHHPGQARGQPRRRFTTAHELVRYLMAHHVPDQPGWFTRKSSDFLRVTAKDGDPRQRREIEANRFATVMLMPPHLLRAAWQPFATPIRGTFLRSPATSRSARRRRLGPTFSATRKIAIGMAGDGRMQRSYRISQPRLSGPHRCGVSPDYLELVRLPTCAISGHRVPSESGPKMFCDSKYPSFAKSRGTMWISVQMYSPRRAVRILALSRYAAHPVTWCKTHRANAASSAASPSAARQSPVCASSPPG